MTKLREKDLVCAEVLVDKSHSVREVSRRLGVAESTLRYRLKRRSPGTMDGRSLQGEACAKHEEAILSWLKEQEDRAGRPDSVRSLYETLVCEHAYTGSYRSVQRYVQRRRPPPRLRPIRRVEVRPGSQAQVDWVAPRVYVSELGGWTPLNAFNLSLSFSRMWSVQWRLDQAQLSWLDAHNGAFRAIGGVPWSVRFDNCKTAVASKGGPWAVLNPAYHSYAEQLGFVPDACRIRMPTDKGKTERRVQDVRAGLIRSSDRFDTLEDLQRISDARIGERAQQLKCPLTDLSIDESWQLERSHLCPLPMTLPTPFDVEVQRTVPRDGLVWFEGRQYGVPFAWMGRSVRVRGCPRSVEIYAGGKHLTSYPRHTACRRLIDQDCYEGKATDRVEAPTRLGKIGQRIVLPRSWDWEAPRRGVDRYALLVEQAGRQA